ncbi:MAG: D-TA family PLP-dependent enzyme [Verrucomicrobiota bacterium]
MTDQPWFEVTNVEEIPSPALLVFPQRVETNITKMLGIVGGDPARLRPHVKTHKMAEVIRLQLNAGIDKFKCATIAEAELTAEAGAQDILLSYQSVGPNIRRFSALSSAFPDTSFAAIVDSPDIVDQMAQQEGDFRLFVDVDCGMGRTGISPADAPELCRKIQETNGVTFAGIHAYDGHIHDASLQTRKGEFDSAMGSIEDLVAEIKPPTLICGGSPTFAMHAGGSWECSPGTTLFWDAGYQSAYPDLDFKVAAVLLSRVASKPGTNRLCLELGHKAIAAENPLDRRVRFLNLKAAVPIMQSEEHLVVEVQDPSAHALGDAIYAVPIHICPTVALHEEAHVIRDGRFSGETWQVAARKRRLTI